MFASESKQLDIFPPYLFENADSPFSIHLHKMEATQNGGYKQVAYKHAFLKYKEKFSFFLLVFFFPHVWGPEEQ